MKCHICTVYENKRRPIMEPWGMPHLMGTEKDEQFHIPTEQLLARKYNLNHLIGYNGV